MATPQAAGSQGKHAVGHVARFYKIIFLSCSNVIVSRSYEMILTL